MIRNHKIKQQGFSLIELMIGLLIGLVIIGAIVEIMFSSVFLFRTQSGLAKLQENARFATSFISQDVRSSSFLGCDINATNINIIVDGTNTTPADLDFSTTLDGENNVAASAFGFTSNQSTVTYNALQNTDILRLRYAKNSNACEIESHNAATNTFTCLANTSLVQNQPLLVSDCSHTAVFLKSNQNPAAGTTTINHAVIATSNPQNCVATLGAGASCSNVPHQFQTGSILPLESLVYFVANNDLGQPALFRQSMEVTAGVLGPNVREIVEGVEDMQLLYGEDTNDNGSVNYYVPFNRIADPENILSLRVDILLRSIENNLVDTSIGQTYQFQNQSITRNDGRLRKVISSTIALRNRL